MNESQTKRGRGRPRKANALTTVQRSQRYRDKKRLSLSEAVDAILVQLTNEASNPYGPKSVKAFLDFVDGCLNDSQPPQGDSEPLGDDFAVGTANPPRSPAIDSGPQSLCEPHRNEDFRYRYHYWHERRQYNGLRKANDR